METQVQVVVYTAGVLLAAGVLAGLLWGVGRLLRRVPSPALWGLAAAGFLFAGAFGAANWAAWADPVYPPISRDDPPAKVEPRLADYQRRVDAVGQGAVIPFVWAVPLTLTGFAAAVACGVAGVKASEG